MAIDNSLLSGVPSPDPVGQPEATPLATPSATPTAQPAAPPAETAAEAAQAARAPQPAQPMRPWQRIFQGALWGLTGIEREGRGGFGTGLTQGVRGYVSQAAQQQQLSFASAQAAANIAKITADAKLADAQGNLARFELQNAALMQNTFLDWMGIKPLGDATADNPDEMNNKAGALLNTAKSSEKDGLIRANIVATNNPSTDSDKMHRVTAYKFSTDWLQQNPGKGRAIVNLAAISKQQSQPTDEEWKMMGVDTSKVNPQNIAGTILSSRHAQSVAATTAYNEMASLPSLEKADPSSRSSAAGATADQANQRHLVEYKQQITNLKDADLSTNPDLADMRDHMVPVMEQNLKAYSQMVKDYHDEVQTSTANQAKLTKAAEIQAESTPEALAAEAAKAKKIGAATEEGKQEASNKPGYAVTTDADGVKHTVQTTYANSQSNNMTDFREVKQADISKDQHDIKVLNDIQAKSDNVKADAKAMDSKSWGQALIAAKLFADNPNTTSENIFKNSAMANATPQTRNYITDIMSLREAAMGMQKLLTGSARNNDAQIKALQATLPGLEPDSNAVLMKVGKFDQNLGMLSEGLPENTGVTLNKPSSVIITTPKGNVIEFPDQKSANAYKKALSGGR